MPQRFLACCDRVSSLTVDLGATFACVPLVGARLLPDSGGLCLAHPGHVVRDPGPALTGLLCPLAARIPRNEEVRDLPAAAPPWGKSLDQVQTFRPDTILH